MRSVLRRPNTALKWTATENMWVDAGTKEMDLGHLRKIMELGTWCITYSPQFVKQVFKARSAKPLVKSSACVEFPGVRLDGNDPVLPYLQSLCEKRGWHMQNGVGIQVAQNAKSFRSPEPRFSPIDLPLRSTFGRFFHPDGQIEWRRIEAGPEYGKLSNQHALIGATVPTLITV